MRSKILVLAALAAAPCFAEPARAPLTSILPSAETGLDPLTRQIQRKLATQADGGLTSFVGLPTGQSIKLESVELSLQPLSGPVDPKKLKPGDPDAGLKTEPALMPKEGKPSNNRRPIKKASEQLKALEKQRARQDWGEGGGKPVTDSPSARRAPKDSLL